LDDNAAHELIAESEEYLDMDAFDQVQDEESEVSKEVQEYLALLRVGESNTSANGSAPEPRMGRPRLDNSKDFEKDFCRLLPRLRTGDISQREAANELGISARTLKRYLKHYEHQELEQ